MKLKAAWTTMGSWVLTLVAIGLLGCRFAGSPSDGGGDLGDSGETDGDADSDSDSDADADSAPSSNSGAFGHVALS